MKIKPRFRDPEKVSLFPEWRCLFNRGHNYKDYFNIFPGSNFVSPEWRCPRVPKERFHSELLVLDRLASLNRLECFQNIFLEITRKWDLEKQVGQGN